MPISRPGGFSPKGGLSSAVFSSASKFSVEALGALPTSTSFSAFGDRELLPGESVELRMGALGNGHDGFGATSPSSGTDWAEALNSACLDGDSDDLLLREGDTLLHGAALGEATAALSASTAALHNTSDLTGSDPSGGFDPNSIAGLGEETKAATADSVLGTSNGTNNMMGSFRPISGRITSESDTNHGSFDENFKSISDKLLTEAFDEL